MLSAFNTEADLTTCVCLYTCMDACMFVFLFIMRVRACACVCVRVRACACVCVRACAWWVPTKRPPMAESSCQNRMWLTLAHTHTTLYPNEQNWVTTSKYHLTQLVQYKSIRCWVYGWYTITNTVNVISSCKPTDCHDCRTCSSAISMRKSDVWTRRGKKILNYFA